MAAKITLTGVRDSKVRKTDKYYAFELTTGGSPTGPKGLPTPSAQVQYTVFVSLKAGRKAGLDSAPSNQKWLIQGEIVLDIPMDKCPGEIGVVAFQISELPTQTKETTDPEPNKQVDTAAPEVAATIEQVPDTDIIQIPIEEIQLPEKFQGATLNPFKTAPVREWVQEHGQLDKPLDVQFLDGVYWLVDGYRRYVVAKDVGLKDVPVRVICN